MSAPTQAAPAPRGRQTHDAGAKTRSYADDLAELERDARELLDDEVAAGRIVIVEQWDASLDGYVPVYVEVTP